jgi:hypothetical protein
MADGIPRPALHYLRSRADELSNLSKTVGLGGIAHHLRRVNDHSASHVDVAGIQAALQDLTAIASNAQEELEASHRGLVEAALGSLSVASSSPMNDAAPGRRIRNTARIFPAETRRSF